MFAFSEYFNGGTLNGGTVKVKSDEFELKPHILGISAFFQPILSIAGSSIDFKFFSLRKAEAETQSSEKSEPKRSQGSRQTASKERRPYDYDLKVIDFKFKMKGDVRHFTCILVNLVQTLILGKENSKLNVKIGYSPSDQVA